MRVVGDFVEGHIRFTAPYAAIHELGGEIRPRKAQYLRIPVGEQKPGGFVLQTKKGNLVVAYREGRQLRVMAVLKRSVRMPARPYLEPQLAADRDQMVRDIGAVVEQHIQTALEGA